MKPINSHIEGRKMQIDLGLLAGNTWIIANAYIIYILLENQKIHIGLHVGVEDGILIVWLESSNPLDYKDYRFII
jgi:hypothetical protein